MNIEYDEFKDGKNSCVVNVIEKRYPKLYKDIKKIETANGIMLKDFINFCKKFEIGYNIFDEHGKELYTHEGNNGLLNCIVYNNHIYITNGGRPKKCSNEVLKITHVKDSTTILTNFVNDKILPKKINVNVIKTPFRLEKINGMNIISFMVGSEKFICNPEYEECLSFLKKINYEHYIYDNIQLSHIPHLLEKLCKADDINSFIPNKGIFKTSPLLWKQDKKFISIETKLSMACEEIRQLYEIASVRTRTEKQTKRINELYDIVDECNAIIEQDDYESEDKSKNDSIVTVDKNKCYPYSLYSLPYLIKFDYRIHNINIKPTKINKDYYLYIAKPKYFSILMPCTKLYPGYFLAECKEMGLEFELLEELESIMLPNYFRNIIKKMYKNMDPNTFKKIFNVYIGTFERDNSREYTYESVGIYNNESLDMYNGFTTPIGDYNLVFKEKEKYLHVRDRIPIATQIKDMSRMLIYKHIKYLGLSDESIIQINTDSISYRNISNKKISEYDYDANKFDGWKKTEYKELGNVFGNVYDESFSAKYMVNPNPEKRILHMKYAGAGKTTYIIDDLVPRLIKEGISYIVITPTHNSANDYRNKNINCEVMQKFVFANSIPVEDYIIVDEIGFIDRACHDLLYNINLACKSFECFGDFNQLQPVGEKLPYNQDHYLKYMFSEFDYEYKNYRNNFTKEFYDKIINNELDIIDVVIYYSTDKMEDAQHILCYRHSTREKYNNLMLEHFKLKNKLDRGCIIICTTNKLIKQNIYNHKQFVIIDNVDEKYILRDDDDKEFIVNGSKKMK